MLVKENQSGKAFFSQPIENVKGIQNTKEAAAERAFGTLSEEISGVYVPRFQRFLMK